MKKKSIEEIEAEIKLRRDGDRKKLKSLGKLAVSGLVTRLVLYALPIDVSGLWIEILWVPFILLAFALPFYGFERLLDKVKSND